MTGKSDVGRAVLQALSDPSQWLLWLVGALVSLAVGCGLRALLKKPEPKRFEGTKRNDRDAVLAERFAADARSGKVMQISPEEYERQKASGEWDRATKPGQIVEVDDFRKLINGTGPAYVTGITDHDLKYRDLSRKRLERAAGLDRQRKGITYPPSELTDEAKEIVREIESDRGLINRYDIRQYDLNRDLDEDL